MYKTQGIKLSYGLTPTSIEVGMGKETDINEVFPITNEDALLAELERRLELFPPLLDLTKLKIIGKPGVTGVVVVTEHNGFDVVIASLPHPRVIPETVHGDNIVFGGVPTNKHLETTTTIPTSPEYASRIAKFILEYLKGAEDFASFSRMFNGMGAIGSELEAWVINPNTGHLAEIPGGELQMGLFEESLPPISDPKHFLMARAKYTLKRAENFGPEYLIVDTSVLPTSNLLSPKVNTKGKLGPYVLAIQRFLWENYFSFSTPEAVQLGDQLAQEVGLDSIEALHRKGGNIAYWIMAASHASVGLHHLRDGDRAMWIPIELVIALSDAFNSDLATVAEFLMLSTPMVCGKTPRLDINGQSYWPYDYRTIMRYLMDTTNPGSFIKSPENMCQRIIDAITNGLTQTADRASYLTEVNGRRVPVAHGRVRNRVYSTEVINPSLASRVECTSCSASPSIIDEAARNCFLQILAIGAMEAVGGGQTPMEYFGGRFPHIATWNKQKNLAIKASAMGFKHPQVKDLIEEAVGFVGYMASNYPALELPAKIATARLQNLLSEPVDSLENYLQNPRGPIAEVIKNEIDKGKDPLELAKMIHEYEIGSAKLLSRKPLFWL